MRTIGTLLIVVTCVFGTRFPPNFKKCNRKDPDANQCFATAAENGIHQLTKGFPQIGLPSFAPLEITELKIGAGSQSVVNVQQHFKNCKLWGFEKVKIQEFSFDFDRKYCVVRGFVPDFKKVCDYELNGRILLLPITGNGESVITLRNVNFTMDFHYELFVKKGKHYHNHTKYHLNLDTEFVSFNFGNLFNGDKQLGDNVNKVLNDNSKEVFLDVKEGYEEALGIALMQIIHTVFSKVSEEEAFD